MPNDELKKSGFVAELKAKIEKPTQEQQRQADTAYKEFIETPAPSLQEMASTSQTPASDSIIYADLAFDSDQYSFQEKVAMDITEYAKIFGCSEEESLQSQIAILKDQKKQYLEKLNQAIDEDKKNAIDDCRSQLIAIETSMATKINYLEKQNNPESKTETQEVSLAQADTNLQGPMVDRSKKPSNVDSSKEYEDELVEKRQQTGDKINRVKFSESTIERDDLKEQQKKESKPEQSTETAKSTTLKSRLEEFSKIWQTPEDKVDLVTTPASNTEKDTHGPSVDRNLKPSRLAQSNFFSPSNASVQDEKKIKKKQAQAFALR